MSDHAVLPPSFSHVWGVCAGAVRAAAQFPNVDTPESLAGTAAHWAFAEVLLNYKGAQQGPLVCSGYVGETAPNGTIIDEAMAEGAQVMVDDVLEVAQAHGSLKDMLIEHRVNMPDVHPDNWGTLDTAIFVPSKSTVYLWDYKHGHRETRAKENSQLINYMVGLANYFGFNGHDDQHVTVVFRIVQPFCYQSGGAVDEWVCRLSDLRGIVNTLHGKAHEALSDDPRLTTGLHCRDCPAVGTCSAARQAGYNLIDVADRPYQMDRMTGAELATERAILSRGITAAKKRLEAIEDDLTHRISQGETGTGLALQSTPGRNAWKIPPTQADALASQFGFNIAVKAVKTPTQATQAAPKAVRAMFEQVLKTVTGRPAGKLKLTDAGDTTVARAFKRK